MYIFSYFDIFPWIILISVQLSICLKKKNEVVKAKLSFFVLWMFSSIRYGIGYDYFSYMEGCLGNWPYYSYEFIEPLAKYLMLWCGKIHYQLFFVITSFLCLYPIYIVASRVTKYPSYALACYLLFPNFFLESLSTVRNSVAISLVFFAIYLYYYRPINNARILSVIPVVVAIGFHTSAIVALLMYPLCYIRLKRRVCILIWLSSFFIGPFISEILLQYLSGDLVYRLEAHMENAATGGQSLMYAVNLLAIINFIFWNKLTKENNENIRLLVFVFVGICIWNMFIFIDSTIALRMSSFFTIFMVLLYANTNVMVSRRLLRNLIISYFCLLFLILIAFQVRGFVSHNIRMGMMPYQTIFYSTYYPTYYDM